MTQINFADNENTTIIPLNTLAKPARLVGLDVANAYVKLTTGEGTEVYPNTTKLLSAEDKRVLESEGNHAEKVYTYTDDNGISNMYKIGLTELGVTSSFGKSDDRYRSEQFKKEFVLALAKIAQKNDVFVVVTGLPSEDYVEESNKAALKEFANRTYSVLVDGVAVNFSISHVFVELQPRGTYLSSVYDIENGQLALKNKELTDVKYVAVVDVGWGTTDVALMTRNGQLTGKFGFAYGMSDAYQLLKDNLISDFKSLKKIPLIEIEAEIREHGELYAGGKLIDKERIVKELDKAFNATAIQIMSNIKNAISLDDLNVCIFTGGGVVALREQLRDKISGEYKKLIANNPQTSNSKGYFIRGLLIKQSGGF